MAVADLWIVENYDRHDADLNDLCREAGWSRRQVQRVFAANGTSFRSWLTRYRMNRASRLLLATRTVRDVASDVGYKQPAQFARAFARQFGLTPSEYRTANSHLRRNS